MVAEDVVAVGYNTLCWAPHFHLSMPVDAIFGVHLHGLFQLVATQLRG